MFYIFYILTNYEVKKKKNKNRLETVFETRTPTRMVYTGPEPRVTLDRMPSGFLAAHGIDIVKAFGRYYCSWFP